MDDWVLMYEDGLFLKLSPNNIESFFASSFYINRIKRYVGNTKDGVISFKNSLTYLDYKKIIGLCERETSKKSLEFKIEHSLIKRIAEKELHLESRSRLGVELKNQDEKHKGYFEEYSNVVDNTMSRKLRTKQMWDSFFMYLMKKSGNFSVPGSGKTSSVLGMYAYLKAKNLVLRIVVICPKNAFGSWIDEFNICFNNIQQLKYFNIQSSAYKSSADKKRAIQLETGSCNLLLFNYESLVPNSYYEEIVSLIDFQTLLVFDEVHKAKRINGHYAMGAINLAKEAHYAVAMTGTPIPNSYSDIYNFLHILFPDEYEDFFAFTPPLLSKPTAADRDIINDKLQPFFCRTTKKQLNVPEANMDMVVSIDASDIENRLLKILKMKYRKNKLALVIRILQLESNPQMLIQSIDLNDFRYLLDDSVDTKEMDFADYSDEVKTLISSWKKTTKFIKCVEQAENLANQGRTVVVWCIFVSSIERLSIELNKRGISTKCIFGDIPLSERLQILSDFRSGLFQVLLTNPHTLAESVSLHSVCHDAIYFECSYNLVHLLQSKDRIHRLGLPSNQYTQYYFLQICYQIEGDYWSMDEVIYHRLMEKEQIMLDAIDNHVLESLPTSNEDLDAIFGKLF